MTTREAFEKWHSLISGLPTAPWQGRMANGDYMSPIIQSDWRVWSAGAKHVQERYAPLLAVAERLQESSDYWSEYDVPVGIVEALKAAIDAAKGKA